MTDTLFFVDGEWQALLPYVPPSLPQRRIRKSGTLFLRGDGMWIGRLELPSTKGKRRQKTVSHRTFCGVLRKFSALDRPDAHVVVPSERSGRRLALAAARLIATHTDVEWAAQLRSQHYQCFYCGIRLRGGLVKEHMTPVSRGGSDGIDNLVGACPRCNFKKGTRTAAEYLRLPRGLR